MKTKALLLFLLLISRLAVRVLWVVVFSRFLDNVGIGIREITGHPLSHYFKIYAIYAVASAGLLFTILFIKNRWVLSIYMGLFIVGHASTTIRKFYLLPPAEYLYILYDVTWLTAFCYLARLILLERNQGAKNKVHKWY